MNWKILILVFGFALTGTAGAAQACEAGKFNALAEGTAAAANNPVLPPVANPANHGAGASACGPGSKLTISPILAWTHKIEAFIDPRIIEKSCLASAVYFEARSESQAGQMAVAMVILNRTKAPNYPSSICGVVYQGASRLNACQFSFACDGKPDLAQDSSAWEAALAVTTLALAGDRQVKHGRMQIVSTATHYHADYVEPHWSKSLHRLTKIGHHIFYSQG
jgi:hypothetical protein